MTLPVQLHQSKLVQILEHVSHLPESLGKIKPDVSAASLFKDEFQPIYKCDSYGNLQL